MTCWRAAPNAAWTRVELQRIGRRCRAAGVDRRRPVRPAVRAGDAAARGGRDGRARRRRRPRWARPSWSARRWRHSPSTPSCWPPNGHASALLLVDDAQHLDPQAAPRLIRVLAAGAELALIAGDPNQAVFGFRGGEPAGLLTEDGPSVTLTVSHRCARPSRARSAALRADCPAAASGRHIDGTGADGGSVTVRLAASAHAEAAMIADALRRAHLIDGVAWSRMLAVIVRSVPRAGSRLPRALAAAGVPVAAPAFGRRCRRTRRARAARGPGRDR